MKYKAYLFSLLFAFPVLSMAAGEADSLRLLQINRLQEQVDWVNPEAIRAYLDDTKSSLRDKTPELYQKLEELETLLPQVRQHLSTDTTRRTTTKHKNYLTSKGRSCWLTRYWI